MIDVCVKKKSETKSEKVSNEETQNGDFVCSWLTSALIVEFMTSQHFSIRPSNWSTAAAANTDTTWFGSSVTSSKYKDPNTTLRAKNEKNTFFLIFHLTKWKISMDGSIIHS